jgi:two-component system, chemotaxis family, chemotaxis protein CheY
MSIADQLRVLIVDDTSTSRMLVRDGLQQIGIKNISHAADGVKALEFMMTTPAHMIISDLNMPNLDGMGLLKKIREYGPTKKVPFIILTAQKDNALIQKAASLGVNNYLVKPFTTDSLRKAIEAIVGKL